MASNSRKFTHDTQAQHDVAINHMNSHQSKRQNFLQAKQKVKHTNKASRRKNANGIVQTLMIQKNEWKSQSIL